MILSFFYFPSTNSTDVIEHEVSIAGYTRSRQEKRRKQILVSFDNKKSPYHDLIPILCSYAKKKNPSSTKKERTKQVNSLNEKELIAFEMYSDNNDELGVTIDQDMYWEY